MTQIQKSRSTSEHSRFQGLRRGPWLLQILLGLLASLDGFMTSARSSCTRPLEIEGGRGPRGRGQNLRRAESPLACAVVLPRGSFPPRSLPRDLAGAPPPPLASEDIEVLFSGGNPNRRHELSHIEWKQPRIRTLRFFQDPGLKRESATRIGNVMFHYK